MEIHPINAGTFKCDGGGIFGSVPKILWSRQIQADQFNLIPIAMRCLLVVSKGRILLIETGAGEKLTEKYAKNNGVENTNSLMASINACGYKAENITDVLHTHLHWDHCGGGTKFDQNGKLVPTFPNAVYHVSKSQWENAMHPNPRENDAYFKDDLIPVQEAGLLNLIENEQELFPGVELRIFNGHTPGQIIPIISYKGKKLVYTSDLIPVVANISLKWVASYDLYPVTTMDEKLRFLREAYENEYILYFEHDLENECATITWDERKGPKLKEKGKLQDILSI